MLAHVCEDSYVCTSHENSAAIMDRRKLLNVLMSVVSVLVSVVPLLVFLLLCLDVSLFLV